uniref:Uncharacterized protein n=1 Tax=Panagrolaimus superbus TaxID=310955 RepID=A0A914YGP0_9BILA
MYWGYEVLSNSLLKNMYLPSRFFPLLTYCRAPIVADNVYVQTTVNCILGMNAYYEKLYVLTYFMLLGIIAASFISAIYYTLLFITPLRTNTIQNLLDVRFSFN